MNPAAIAAPCDCCGSKDWEYLLAANSYHLGRCGSCGLLYVGNPPSAAQRLEELHQGVFGGGRRINAAGRHLRGEEMRRQRYQRLVALTQKLAPLGRWLDIGCGTGTLLRIVEEHGIAIDGIELTRARRDVARQQSSARVYEQPLEDLHLPDASYAAILMVNVFSHLVSPRATLAEIHRILVAGGIVVIWTSEIGSGVKPHHMWDWGTGRPFAVFGRYDDRALCRTLRLRGGQARALVAAGRPLFPRAPRVAWRIRRPQCGEAPRAGRTGSFPAFSHGDDLSSERQSGVCVAARTATALIVPLRSGRRRKNSPESRGPPWTTAPLIAGKTGPAIGAC
jgi:SAM-dependent methyltransferase